VPRLTEYSHGAGCACKLGPSQLEEVLGGLDLPSGVAPEVLVGAETSDDAAVYLPPGAPQAVIATTDFFTPIVDDPFDWGRIAAANAVSDIYAMAGRPAFALNLTAWPVDELPLEMLGRVLAGGAKVAAEAGFAILGGHSITDPEPKYGMVVIGFAPPDRIVRNSTARPGDRLFLTKPLGIGMITTAIKRGAAAGEQIDAAVNAMTTLNGPASEAMVEAGATAATDVTGFGLLGHLREMCVAAGIAAEIDAGAPALLPGVLDLAGRDVVAGGTKRNHAHVRAFVDWGDLTLPEQLVLADAQTSGGLLVAVPSAEAAREAFAGRGIAAVEIGVCTEGSPRITVRGRIAG
jgi:selenide,water dikinase